MKIQAFEAFVGTTEYRVLSAEQKAQLQEHYAKMRTFVFLFQADYMVDAHGGPVNDIALAHHFAEEALAASRAITSGDEEAPAPEPKHSTDAVEETKEQTFEWGGDEDDDKTEAVASEAGDRPPTPEAKPAKQTFATKAAAASTRPFTDETVQAPVSLPRRAGTTVLYHPCTVEPLQKDACVWDARTPLAVAEDAVRRVARREFVGQPITACDFSGVEYEEKGHKFKQADGSVRPSRYKGDDAHEFSICYGSTQPSGCKDASCRHRHKFFCLKEAKAVVYKGGKDFVLSWAKALEKNNTARNDLIPQSMSPALRRDPAPVAPVVRPTSGGRGGLARGRARGGRDIPLSGRGRQARPVPDPHPAIKLADQIQAEKSRAEDEAAARAGRRPDYEFKETFRQTGSSETRRSGPDLEKQAAEKKKKEEAKKEEAKKEEAKKEEAKKKEEEAKKKEEEAKQKEEEAKKKKKKKAEKEKKEEEEKKKKTEAEELGFDDSDIADADVTSNSRF
jgi:hypothetical protein